MSSSNSIIEEAERLGMNVLELPLLIAKNEASRYLNELIDNIIPDIDQYTNEDALIVLKNRLRKIGFILQILSEDPEIKKLMKESTELVGVFTREVMENIQGPLDEITENGLKLLADVSERTAKTATQTGKKILKSVLDEIPGGVFVSLAFDGSDVFTDAIKGLAESIETTNKLVISGNKLTNGMLEPIENGFERYNNIKNKYSNIHERITSKMHDYSNSLENLINKENEIGALKKNMMINLPRTPKINLPRTPKINLPRTPKINLPRTPKINHGIPTKRLKGGTRRYKLSSHRHTRKR